MLRNYPKAFTGPYGTAALNGSQDCWLLTWSGASGPLEYRDVHAARAAARAFVDRGKDPRSADTIRLDAALPPRGAFV